MVVLPADRPLALEQRDLAEQHPEQGRLAAPVSPGDGQSLSRDEVEVDRAETEGATLRHRAVQRGDEVAGRPLACIQRQAELPGLERLLRQLVALEQAFGLAHLGRQRMRGAPVGAARRLTQSRTLRARLRPASAQQRGERAPLSLGMLELRVRCPARLAPREPRTPPASCELPHTVLPGVDLDDPGGHPVEEGPIVRDDDEPAGEGADESLQTLEPVEVEIVRRLVETEDVEAREQDGREGRARRLAPRQRRGCATERDREAEIGADGAGARLEIPTAEREKPAQSSVVELGRVSSAGGESRGCPLELELGGGHAGSAPESVEQRFVRACFTLLRDIADGEIARRTRDRPAVGLVETCNQPQQRRLADAVWADDPEAAARPDTERDLIENRLGAVALGNACKLHSHEGLLTERRKAPPLGRLGHGIGSVSSSWVGACAPRRIVAPHGPTAPPALRQEA